MGIGTFKVDHHGGKTTDPHLCWDEVCKAAYRNQCANSVVAGDHIGGLRARIAALEAEVERLKKYADHHEGCAYYVIRVVDDRRPCTCGFTQPAAEEGGASDE